VGLLGRSPAGERAVDHHLGEHLDRTLDPRDRQHELLLLRVDLSAAIL
jgi:hypothetical protein